MGDPHHRKFPVYLPPRYDARRAEPYPVVFVLSGWGGRAAKYLGEESVFVSPLEDRLDAAVERGELPGFVAVFVDGASKLGCSQYVNSPAIGNYSDYICDELVEFIDSRFHTHRQENFRALLGHSSGGFGALWNAFHRPDRFRLVCSSAADSFFEASLLPNVIVSVEILENEGGIEAFCKNFLSHPNPSSLGAKKFNTMLTLSMAPCYAPNLKVPAIFGDLFFDLKTGRIREEIWEKYLAFDPVRLVAILPTQINRLKYILLESGLSDEHGLQLGQRQIAEELQKLSVDVDLVEYSGGHSNHNWRFELRVKKLLERMPR